MQNSANILIYDSNSSHEMCSLLESLPHITIPVGTVDKAEKALQRFPIHLLICNLNISDVEIGLFLREMISTTPGVKVILIGPISHENRADMLIDAGLAHDYIQAPVGRETLKDRVSLIFEDSKFHNPKQNRRLSDYQHEKESRYELQALIAEGGESKVYRARDLLLNMPVAIKMLPITISHDKSAFSTLRNEARVAMHLNHRHIVSLYNLSRINGHYCLIMEYIPGETLHDLCQRSGALAYETVSQIIRVCGDAIAYAHRKGVFHNDLKPGNIILSTSGVLKIIDFGIARLTSGKLNREKRITGTPAYMSPERQNGEESDEQTDVYALGMIAYELLSGKLPFPNNIHSEDLIGVKPEPLLGIPTPLRQVLETALAHDRKQRWPDIASFANRFIETCKELETGRSISGMNSDKKLPDPSFPLLTLPAQNSY